MKKENAITLVALVISIIVLIILASITINTLINNGIIDKTKNAKEQYQNAQEYEETQIAKYVNDINEYVDGTRNTVTISEDEYNQLRKDATTIQVSVNIPTKAAANNDWVKITDYPSTYNNNDLYIKSFICEVNGNPETSYFGCQFSLRTDGIYYWANDFGRWNCPITIFLGLK